MKDSMVLILGANGQLGKQFQKELLSRNIRFAAPEEMDCNITHFDEMKRLIDSISPDIIINCAAYNMVDDAESNDSLANLINNKAVENIAKVCNRIGAFFVHYSTDYVFDGQKGDLYFEDDKTNPINAYGKSKLAGERAVLDNLSNSLVFRPSWVYGDGTQNFIFKLLGWASKNRILKISCDEVSIPTSAHDLAIISIELISKKITGLYHLTNSGYCSRYEWCRFILEVLNKKNVVVPVSMSTFNTPRPRFTPLSNRNISEILNHDIPDWKTSLKSYLLDKYQSNHEKEVGA